MPDDVQVEKPNAPANHEPPPERFQQVHARMKAAEARVAELAKEAEEVPRLRATIERERTLREIETTMLGSEYPAMKHADVRQFFVGQYDQHRAQAGDKAKVFGEWFGEVQKSSSPLFAPFFAKPAAEVKVEAKAEDVREPANKEGLDVNGGRVTTTGAKKTTYTPEEITRIMKLSRTSEERKALDAYMRDKNLIR